MGNQNSNLKRGSGSETDAEFVERFAGPSDGDYDSDDGLSDEQQAIERLRRDPYELTDIPGSTERDLKIGWYRRLQRRDQEARKALGKEAARIPPLPPIHEICDRLERSEHYDRRLKNAASAEAKRRAVERAASKSRSEHNRETVNERHKREKFARDAAKRVVTDFVVNELARDPGMKNGDLAHAVMNEAQMGKSQVAIALKAVGYSPHAEVDRLSGFSFVMSEIPKARKDPRAPARPQSKRTKRRKSAKKSGKAG